MPLISLYISTVITSSFSYFIMILSVKHCSNRSVTRKLQQEQKFFRPRVKHRKSFWMLLPLLLFSLFTSLTEPAVSFSLETNYNSSITTTMLHSVRNRHLIALPFVQLPIVPVIAPVAAYPKRLCLFKQCST
jgi:hypothetical protein